MSNPGTLLHSFFYQGNLCNIIQLEYAERDAEGNARPALVAIAADHPDNLDKSIRPGEHIAVLSINMPEIELNPGEYIIKDYSENQWIVQDLLNEGFLIPTGLGVALDWSNAPICTINPTQES